MEKNLKSLMAARLEGFRLPRYHELPNVGLYLEQVTKYINGFLAPLGCMEITSSMVSNYVKKGVITSPIKKQYYADQIGYLIFISIAKNILSMENIVKLIEVQKASYDPPTAYNYFCSEFENMLWYICGKQDSVKTVGKSNGEEKLMLRSVIIAASHMIFLSNCFDMLTPKQEDTDKSEQ